MKNLMIIALVAAGFTAAMPVRADDMNPTDTRAEFTVRKANHGKYNPAMHKGAHKKEMKKYMGKKHMGKKAMKKAK